MGGPAWLALLSASLAAAAAPQIRGERADPDLELRNAPPQGDVSELIRLLDSRITGDSVAPIQGVEVGPENIPSLDLYIAGLKKRLAEAPEKPIEILLGQVEGARRTFRLAYNDIAAAEPALAEARDALKEAAEKLASLLERNRESVATLDAVASMAEATVSAMSADPPASPGRPVPVEALCAIRPLKPEILALAARLQQAAGKLKEARRLLDGAKRQRETAARQGGEAYEYYADNMDRLNRRPVAGKPGRFHSQTQLEQIIENASYALDAVLAESGRLIGEISAQLDPRKEGMRRAVDKSLEADARTQTGRVLGEKGGSRINFNHGIRLLPRRGLIPRGYEIAEGSRRQGWWVGRAGLAISEAQAELAKMRRGSMRAEEAAAAAEGLLARSAGEVAKIDRRLGDDGALGPQPIAAAEGSGYSAPPAPSPAARADGPRSKPVKINALGVSRDDILGLFRTGAAP